MRLRPIFFTLFGVALAWSAQAQTDAPPPDTPPDAAASADMSADSQTDLQESQQRFQEGLNNLCPDKQLQLLSARDLSDGLDQYKSGVASDLRDRLTKAETDHCSTLNAGAACVNLADIAAADAAGHMDDLVLSICTTFLRCRDAGVCDYAR
jgi:hypothetical protein